jgi:hypothetical protein
VVGVDAPLDAAFAEGVAGGCFAVIRAMPDPAATASSVSTAVATMIRGWLRRRTFTCAAVPDERSSSDEVRMTPPGDMRRIRRRSSKFRPGW